MPTPAEPPGGAGWSAVLAEVRGLADAGHPVQALARIIAALRPSGARPAADRVVSLAGHLEVERAAGGAEGASLGRLLRRVLRDAHSVHTLTDAGIPSSHRGFWSEFFGRLGRRVLPDPTDPASLTAVLQAVFPRQDDHVWVRRIPTAHWARLLDAMGVTAESVTGVDPDLANAIRVLAHHVASLGLSSEVTERLPDLEGPASPFLVISAAVSRYLESFENEEVGDEEPLLDEALALLTECREAVERLRAEKGEFGTNLSLTILSYRLLQQIERLDVLLHLTEPVERDFQGSAVRLFRTLVRAVNTRNQVVPHVRESADLLAYQVVEFAARKGSRYITRSPREYGLFFVSSLGGGLIVAVFALLKVLLDTLYVSLAAEAFLFGINYSICFVLIYLTGSTLATKQPAMTANTLARTLGGTSDHDIKALQELVVRTWRSQFVSFLGNLVMAFPVALGLSWGFHRLTGVPPAAPAKAAALLEGLHPWQSGALAYAAVAGVFLFASGLVSGYVDNRNRYGRIPLRIEQDPRLRRILGLGGAARLASFVDRKLGVLAGNVFLGFCLGSAGTVGTILGLPFDIRHIAFASAHFGMAMEALNWAIPVSLLLEVTLGVLLIGLVNFLVSFGLSLALAMESRRVTFGETRALVRGLLRHFLRRPLDYFFPPLRRRKSTPA
jgi:site-specific recombinase